MEAGGGIGIAAAAAAAVGGGRGGASHPFTLCFFVGSLKLKRFRILCRQTYHRHPKNPALARQIIQKWRLDGHVHGKECFVDCVSLIQKLNKNGMPLLAEEILLEMKCEGFLPDNSTLCAMMLCYANHGHFPQAQVIWEEMLYSGFLPNIEVVSGLMDAYVKAGLFNKVTKILEDLCFRDFNRLAEVYSLAISCFGKGGQLELMESTLKQMVSRGFPVGSSTGNAFVRYYSIFGSLAEMEAAYGRLKRSRHLLDKEGIRAVSLAYIRKRKFFRLGEFLRDVGLARRDVGNLIWNFLLLSYATNFKMKTLQREFLRMVEAGFHPDLITFNIRALAFSRMLLLWDLHLSLEHMNHEKVVPDLVTYGCVVDAYLDRRLGRNLDFVLNRMNVEDSPVLLTDSFVFEALGKGDFHSSAEAFLENKKQGKWTYRMLIGLYLRKQYRSNQIFWNY
uniref:Pentatricopeptide repeat-containing protein n=1 Tax=Rhizophora mucronata TaxID=61149 RepID=A0A2P2MZ08_RHIMU